MINRAIAYIRQNSLHPDPKGAATSLAHQQWKMNNLIRYFGLSVANSDIYVEDIVDDSATLQQRPVLQQVLNILDNRTPRVALLIQDLNTLSPIQREQNILIKEIIDRNYILYCGSPILDTSTAEDQQALRRLLTIGVC